jgi:hypothetical protein
MKKERIVKHPYIQEYIKNGKKITFQIPKLSTLGGEMLYFSSV